MTKSQNTTPHCKWDVREEILRWKNERQHLGKVGQLIPRTGKWAGEEESDELEYIHQPRSRNVPQDSTLAVLDIVGTFFCFLKFKVLANPWNMTFSKDPIRRTKLTLFHPPHGYLLLNLRSGLWYHILLSEALLTMLTQIDNPPLLF